MTTGDDSDGAVPVLRARTTRPTPPPRRRWPRSMSSTTGSRPRATGSSPAASGPPTRPPSSTTGARRRCSPTGPSWSRRSTSPASGSSRPPTSTWRSSSPPRGRRPAIGRVEVRPFLVSSIDVRDAITRAHREEWARVVAALARRFGDLDIAEEAAAEAFATAVRAGRLDGVPPNPGAWLTTTANRKAIDRLRRESQARRQAQGGADAVRRRRARVRSAPSTTTGSASSSPAATPLSPWRRGLR